MVQTPPPSPRGTGPNRWLWFLIVAVGLTGLIVWLIDRYPNALDSRDAMINITATAPSCCWWPAASWPAGR